LDGLFGAFGIDFLQGLAKANLNRASEIEEAVKQRALFSARGYRSPETVEMRGDHGSPGLFMEAPEALPEAAHVASVSAGAFWEDDDCLAISEGLGGFFEALLSLGLTATFDGHEDDAHQLEEPSQAPDIVFGLHDETQGPFISEGHGQEIDSRGVIKDNDRGAFFGKIFFLPDLEIEVKMEGEPEKYSSEKLLDSERFSSRGGSWCGI
jgi:hypothetical protein